MNFVYIMHWVIIAEGQNHLHCKTNKETSKRNWLYACLPLKFTVFSNTWPLWIHNLCASSMLYSKLLLVVLVLYSFLINTFYLFIFCLVLVLFSVESIKMSVSPNARNGIATLNVFTINETKAVFPSKILGWVRIYCGKCYDPSETF